MIRLPDEDLRLILNALDFYQKIVEHFGDNKTLSEIQKVRNILFQSVN